jgi:hypothetical protein
VFGVVEISGAELRTHDPSKDPTSKGISRTQGPRTFELYRDRPSSQPMYYRIGHGRLEWGPEIDDFGTDAESPIPDAGTLVSYVHGGAPAPGRTPLPGVHQLSLGTAVQVDSDGVRVTRRGPSPLSGSTSLVAAVRQFLESRPGSYSIAYSGGLGSAFVAACALEAGHRPRLVHADLDLVGPAVLAPGGRGLALERVLVDGSELLDHHRITGSEVFPPMPDVEVPRLLMAHLARVTGTELVTGSLLKDLVSIKLPNVDLGRRNWRLLGCEPFHIAGRLRSLREAQALLNEKIVYSAGSDSEELDDRQPLHAPTPLPPSGVSNLPGLSDTGRQAFESTRRGAMALWKDHLEALPPVYGRVVAGLAERGDAGAVSPALDLAVIAAVDRMSPAKLGRIRGGRFEAHLPLQTLLDRHGVSGVRRATPGHWLRLAAAHHLHRERSKIIAQLERECALGDLGLFDPRAVQAVLQDGRLLAENAMALLRLVWLDQWLRGRA